MFLGRSRNDNNYKADMLNLLRLRRRRMHKWHCEVEPGGVCSQHKTHHEDRLDDEAMARFRVAAGLPPRNTSQAI